MLCSHRRYGTHPTVNHVCLLLTYMCAEAGNRLFVWFKILWVKSLFFSSLFFFLLKWSYVCSKIASALWFCPQSIPLIGIRHCLHVCDGKLLSIHPGVWFQGVMLKAVCHMEPWAWVIVVKGKSAVPARCTCVAVSVMWYETYFTSAWTRNSEAFAYFFCLEKGVHV